MASTAVPSISRRFAASVLYHVHFQAQLGKDVLSVEQQPGQTGAETEPARLTTADRHKQISRDKRLSRYEEVIALHRDSYGQRAIARHLERVQEGFPG